MENLEERWKKLALTEEEECEIQINEDELKKGKIDGEFCLVGRVLFERVIHKEVLRNTMKKIWKTSLSFDVHSLGINLYVIRFDSLRDAEKNIYWKALVI